jgi:hypothetical protein
MQQSETVSVYGEACVCVCVCVRIRRIFREKILYGLRYWPYQRSYTGVKIERNNEKLKLRG